MVIAPRTRGTKFTPSTMEPPASADCLNPPLKTATTPGGPSELQSMAGPASTGTLANRLGSVDPTCQRSKVVGASRSNVRKVTAPILILRYSTMTPRRDELATVQPARALTSGTVVEVVAADVLAPIRSEEHTSELQSL